jgi:hypothetical protein
MKPAKKVFIAGSRRISRLNAEAMRRMDNVLARGFHILVGDANGADKAVQQYLHARHYPHVLVFCMKSACRNNVGSWPTGKSSPMRDGLMLWDGASRGTLTNIVDLVRQGKPVLVLIPSRKASFTLRKSRDLEHMLGDSSEAKRIDRELEGEHKVRERRVNSALLF